MLRQSVGDRILTFGNLLQYIGGKISSGITYLFYDTFTGADGTLLTAHTPDVGGAWSSPSGSQVIASNKIHSNTVNSTAINASIVGSNIVASADLYSTTKLREGAISARVVDAANGWHSYIEYSGNRHRLYELTSGSYVSRALASITPHANTVAHMVFTVNGTALVSVLSGDVSSTISYTSSTHQTGNKIGMEFSSGTDVYIDNLMVVAA